MAEIVQKFNEIYEPVFITDARYIHIHGGRSRGGSHFGTDYFLHLITQPSYFRGYFLREVFNDIRGSLWQDFKDRIEDNDTIDINNFALNENSMTATYLPTGNTISSKGFKKSSGKSTAKLKSIAGATHVLVEEADEVDEYDFDQLDISLRTVKSNKIQVIMIFNPPNKDHWIIKRWYNLISFSEQEKEKEPFLDGYFNYEPKNDPSLCSIHSTYKDNLANVNETTVNRLEAFKNNNIEYYCTMVRGLVSEGMKGVIFKNWRPISDKLYDDLPYEEFYGLDFGYSNDPVAVIAIKHHNNKLYLRQKVYQSGLTNRMLSASMFSAGINPTTARITADSAEPKSIDDLIDFGWINVVGASKGKDSVNFGIKYLLDMEIYYCESSTDLIYEKNNYKWGLDANKNPTDKPEDKNNHLMDALRYGVEDLMEPEIVVL